LLFDSGDLIQGNPLGDFVAVEQRLQLGQVHPVFKALNLLDYTAASLGNHEFNYGLDFLRLALAGAHFPYVTANVFVAGRDRAAAPPLIKPYVILDRDCIDEAGITRRLRVGVIGFVPPQIMQWDKANLDGRVFVIDIVEAARRYVPQMRAAGADLVVALVHSGLSAAPPLGPARQRGWRERCRLPPPRVRGRRQPRRVPPPWCSGPGVRQTARGSTSRAAPSTACRRSWPGSGAATWASST